MASKQGREVSIVDELNGRDLTGCHQRSPEVYRRGQVKGIPGGGPGVIAVVQDLTRPRGRRYLG